MVPKDDTESGSESAGYISSSNEATSSDEEEAQNRLESTTISVDQLCRKLKKLNHKFEYDVINEDDEWSAEHVTDLLSSAKRQRHFIDAIAGEIIRW